MNAPDLAQSMRVGFRDVRGDGDFRFTSGNAPAFPKRAPHLGKFPIAIRHHQKSK